MNYSTRLLIVLAFFIFNAKNVFAQQHSILQTNVQTVLDDQPLKATVDTLCGSWHICLTDNRPLKYVFLLNDTSGSVVKPARIYQNTLLNNSADVTYRKQINFNLLDTNVCFDAVPVNALDSAFVPLYVVDTSGDVIIVDLYYRSLQIRKALLTDLAKRVDTINFQKTKVGNEICTTFYYIKSQDTTVKNFAVNSVMMNNGNSDYRIASVLPQLPTVLKPGDTMKMQLCFNPKNSGHSYDSILVVSDCITSATMVSGFGVKPSIIAGDINFPSVEIDTLNGEFLTIKNNGDISYNLTKTFKLSDTINFSVDSLSAAKLPKFLKPLDSAKLKIIFHPQSIGKDTAKIDWVTDIDNTYSLDGKKYSILIGNGVPPKVNSVNIEDENNNEFSIHPNPASSSIECIIPNPLESNKSLYILDALGRIIYRNDIPSGIAQIKIPILNFAEGLYYIQLFSRFGSASRSFIKVK